MKNKPKFNRISAVLIWSENHEELVNWYKDKLQLSVEEELTHPQDTGTLFVCGGVYLWIGKHSDVHGKNMDNARHMFNISVDSVGETYALLQQNGVVFIAEPFEAPTDQGTYFATFKDLDNNLIQLIGGI